METSEIILEIQKLFDKSDWDEDELYFFNTLEELIQNNNNKYKIAKRSMCRYQIIKRIKTTDWFKNHCKHKSVIENLLKGLKVTHFWLDKETNNFKLRLEFSHHNLVMITQIKLVDNNKQLYKVAVYINTLKDDDKRNTFVILFDPFITKGSVNNNEDNKIPNFDEIINILPPSFKNITRFEILHLFYSLLLYFDRSFITTRSPMSFTHPWSIKQTLDQVNKTLKSC